MDSGPHRSHDEVGLGGVRSRDNRRSGIAPYLTLECNELRRRDRVDRDDDEVEVALAHLRESRFTIWCQRAGDESKARENPLDLIGGTGGVCRNERATLHQFSSANDWGRRSLRRVVESLLDCVTRRQRRVGQQLQNILRTRIERIDDDWRDDDQQLALVVSPGGAREEVADDGQVLDDWNSSLYALLLVVEKSGDDHALVPPHVHGRRDTARSERRNSKP